MSGHGVSVASMACMDGWMYGWDAVISVHRTTGQAYPRYELVQRDLFLLDRQILWGWDLCVIFQSNL